MSTTYTTQYHLLARTSVDSAGKRRFIDGVQKKQFLSWKSWKIRKKYFRFFYWSYHWTTHLHSKFEPLRPCWELCDAIFDFFRVILTASGEITLFPKWSWQSQNLNFFKNKISTFKIISQTIVFQRKYHEIELLLYIRSWMQVTIWKNMLKMSVFYCDRWIWQVQILKKISKFFLWGPADDHRCQTKHSGGDAHSFLILSYSKTVNQTLTSKIVSRMRPPAAA